MKLELKHLAPYLPYELKACATDVDYIDKVTAHNVTHIVYEQDKVKPILRPLSDLTKEIEHNGERFVPKKRLDTVCFTERDEDWLEELMSSLPLHDWQLLFSWHFDVFGLIDAGLAIDINTLKQE